MKGAGLGARGGVALAAAGVAAAALAGCSSGAVARSTGATVPDTTLAANPYAVPAHITVAYVQRVLDALEGVNSRAIVAIVTSRQFNSDAVASLQAIFVPSVFADQANLWASEIGSGLKDYRVNPGPVRDQVLALISARSNCVYTSVDRDYSAVVVTPPAPQTVYIELVGASSASHPSDVNPTPWAIGQIGYESNGSQPPDPCTGS